MSNFNFSMAVLYTVCRLAWQNCLNNIAVFSARKGFYTAAFIAARMAEIDSAENLPDEQARDDAHESLRVQLEQKAATCKEYWKFLERYIVSAYAKEFQKSKIEAAGKEQYDDAGENNWDVIALMMSNGHQFILNNAAVLAINLELGTPDNMPATFAAEFEGVMTDFNDTLSDFLVAEEGSQTGTQTKTEANDVIYDKMRVMLDDGVVYFKNNASVKKQFVLTNLLELVGTPTGGGTTYDGPVNSGQVVNVLNASTPKYVVNVKLRLKNTTPIGSSPSDIVNLGFYPANNPGDGYPGGSNPQLTNGQEVEIDVTAVDFKPYFNVHNLSGNAGSFEIEVLN